MIRYTVVWHLDAQNQLAQLWADATDRTTVNQAVDAIDALLARDATSKGAPVEGDLRELLIPPLRVWFGVSEPDRLVKIVHAETL